jgi:hypothetical protein
VFLGFSGFCQVVLERAQFLDMTLDSAQMMTVLGSLLAESAALKRADAMLRQALEYFWRELKGPHQAVARNYKVRCCLAWLVETQHSGWCW